MSIPKVKLAQQLKTPGGPAVAEALVAATKNLHGLKKECVEDLSGVLLQAEACLASFPATYADEPLIEMYSIASQPIGVASTVGLEAIDTALISLCDLIENLKTRFLWDNDAVAVHVQSLRLLLMKAGSSELAGAEAILTGLRKVSARYAETSDSSPAA